jgi:antitoxin component YwqK of YwqJK toxin-antitoxin module
MTFGQEVEKYNYPNGQLKSEITYNKDHVLTKYCNWDQFGNLLTLEDFSILYKELRVEEKHFTYLCELDGLNN